MSRQADLNIGDRLLYRLGVGNWDAFQNSDMTLEKIFAAATEWNQRLAGLDLPWLCWNVNNDWCLVQQRLVHSVGWTPVVGYDPRVGPPDLLQSSILLDFNARFGLPTLYMHFPLEFAFRFADRLAFWHSDLLVRPQTMKKLASRFAALEDGAVAAVRARFSWRDRLNVKGQRYWELIGCTTRQASKDQFEKGCGWWMHIEQHPNCTDERERARRSRYYWDHGVGIRYWKRNYGGSVHAIPEREVEEGHCTAIGNSRYESLSPRNEEKNLSLDLPHNFDLPAVCAKLGISH